MMLYLTKLRIECMCKSLTHTDTTDTDTRFGRSNSKSRSSGPFRSHFQNIYSYEGRLVQAIAFYLEQICICKHERPVLSDIIDELWTCKLQGCYYLLTPLHPMWSVSLHRTPPQTTSHNKISNNIDARTSVFEIDSGCQHTSTTMNTDTMACSYGFTLLCLSCCHSKCQLQPGTVEYGHPLTGADCARTSP